MVRWISEIIVYGMVAFRSFQNHSITGFAVLMRL